MPLPFDDWARGKCGYKLLQVMAASKPVIGSAFGANLDIVQNGENGFLASSTPEWVMAFRRLIEDPALHDRMGLAGRRTVERRYSLLARVDQRATLLREVAEMGQGHVKTRRSDQLAASDLVVY